jgi:N6-L-threonylcarbamoyladenine synthase
MLVLGIETSCDECSVAVVEDGTRLRGMLIATQDEVHAPYSGVVPELASRRHIETILPIFREAIDEARCSPEELDLVAVTVQPGLAGSLAVGVAFAKALALGLGRPVVGVDHIPAHLYAIQLERQVDYPFLGLVISGGHTLIARVSGPTELEVLGTTIDDACGEAFDKVAKHLDLGYPGGIAIDRLARRGDPKAFRFPVPSLHKGDHRYDVSYSGLKTAVVNQLEQFRTAGYPATPENIAASFEASAVDMALNRLRRAQRDTGLSRVVVAGGVASNSYLRARLTEWSGGDVFIPSKRLCTDNGAMVAGLGYHVYRDQGAGELDLDILPKVAAFRGNYP